LDDLDLVLYLYTCSCWAWRLESEKELPKNWLWLWVGIVRSGDAWKDSTNTLASPELLKQLSFDESNIDTANAASRVTDSDFMVI